MLRQLKAMETQAELLKELGERRAIHFTVHFTRSPRLLYTWKKWRKSDESDFTTDPPTPQHHELLIRTRDCFFWSCFVVCSSHDKGPGLEVHRSCSFDLRLAYSFATACCQLFWTANSYRKLLCTLQTILNHFLQFWPALEDLEW